MSRSLKVNLSKYLTTLTVAIVMAVLYVTSRWDTSLSLTDKYCVLCDGFSVPGILIVSIAVLISMNNLGALDGIAYVLGFVPRLLFPAAFGQQERYLDYVEARREKRVKGYGFLYVVGLIFLGFSIVFLVLFFNAGG